jgi:hypothetical protein
VTRSGMSMRMARALETLDEQAVPETPAARLEWVMELVLGPTMYDDNDRPTGERGAPMITWEQAAKLLRGEVPS